MKLEWNEIEYRHGDNMSYIRKDWSATLQTTDSAPPVLTSNDIPEWDIVLGMDQVFNPDETYPLIAREEMKAIMDWLGSLVEYAEGGKHFQMYKASDGTIEVALVHDENAPSLAPPVGTIVMKLKGRTTKPEDENQRMSEITANERNHDDNDEGERPQPPDVPENVSGYVTENQNDLISNDIPAIEPHSPDATQTNQEIVRVCLHVGRDEEQAIKSHEESGIAPESLEGEALDDEDGRNALDPAQRIYQDLREMRDVSFLPPPDILSNGLLAAREFIPIAQYGGTDDYEFYGRGVTLVMEDEDEKPVYYRGNALVRVTDDGLVPDTRPPTRARTNQMRERLFRTGRYAVPKAKIDKDLWEKRPEDDPMTGTLAGAPEMSDEELAAVLTKLMDDPIEEMKEKRTYEIHKGKNGTVLVTRVPFDTTEWTNDEELAKEGKVNDEECKEEGQTTQPTIGLTRLGNNPQPSDRGSARNDEVHEISSADWGGIPWDPRDGSGSSQPWWNTPDNEEIEAFNLLEQWKTIKQTGLAHQEESFRNPPSPPLPLDNDTDTPSLCLLLMGPPLTPTRKVPRQMSSRSAVCSVEPFPPQFGPLSPHSEQLADDEIFIPPPPAIRRPGILTASHLTLVKDWESTPRDPSFFAYGARTVLEDVQGDILEFEGHAVIHMYPFDTPMTHHFPPPLPRDRTESARASLLVYPMPRQSPGPDSIGRVPRFDPPFPLEEYQLTPRNQKPGDPVQIGRVIVPDDPLRRRGIVDLPDGPLNKDQETMPEKKSEIVVIGEVQNGLAITRKRTYRIKTDAVADFRRVGLVKASALPSISEAVDSPKESRVKGSDTFPLSGTPVKEQSAKPFDDDDKTLTNDEESADVEMQLLDNDNDGYATPGSMPDLETVSSTTTDDEEDEKPVEPEPKNPEPGEISKSRGWETSKEVCTATVLSGENAIRFAIWEEQVSHLSLILEEGVWWSNNESKRLFLALGLLSWGRAIQRARRERRYPIWEVWVKKLVQEWHRRFPNVPANRFKIPLMNGRYTLAVAPDPSDVTEEHLYMRMGDIIKMDEDVEMADDSPMKSPPTSEPIKILFPSQPPPTPEPVKVLFAPKPPPADGVHHYPRAPDVDEIGELRSRIAELEDQFACAEDDARTNLKNLREQVFTDGVTLTDLKWRLAEVEEKKKKQRGKRAYRKARGKGPSHRYPTRYSVMAKFDEVVEVGKREYEDLEGRIQKIETRQEKVKEEIERIEADLARAVKVAPQISTLTKSLEEFKTAQLRINLNIIQELLRLKSTYAEVLEKRTSAHTTELSLLTARFNVLQSIATSLIASRVPDTPAFHPPPSYKPYHIPGYPLPVGPPARLAPNQYNNQNVAPRRLPPV